MSRAGDSRARSARPVYDCQTCGACCTNPDENRREGFRDWVAVGRDEPLLEDAALTARFVVTNARGGRHLKLVDDQRCAALRGKLGRRVTCTIYDVRPAGCRRVEAGDRRCLQYRKERGIDP